MRTTTPEDTPKPSNRTALIRFALMVAAAVFFASFLPPNLMIAGVSSFLFFATVANVVWAVILREKMSSRRLTRWDEAAGTYALSLAFQFMVNPETLAPL